MTGTGALFLTIMMIAVFALAAGGVQILARGGDRKRALLMLVAALVILGNVLIWSL